MDRTLREHILELEQKIQFLSARLMDERPGVLKGQASLEAQLRALQSALTLYRSAFEIELRAERAHKPVPGILTGSEDGDQKQPE
jgi:uncharacterized protein involved in exopolysaccharide biosynthesis